MTGRAGMAKRILLLPVLPSVILSQCTKVCAHTPTHTHTQNKKRRKEKERGRKRPGELPVSGGRHLGQTALFAAQPQPAAECRQTQELRKCHYPPQRRPAAHSYDLMIS